MSLDSRENLQSVEDIKTEAIKLVADDQLHASEGQLFRSVKCSIKTYKLEPSKKMSGIKQIKVAIAEDEEHDDDMGLVELDNGLVIYKKLVERLYPHQINGVKWMYNLFKNRKKGGILADDMGLGKTIQMIAYISAMFGMQRIKNVLLVIPLSVIPNWVAEFKNWAPEIWVECFHGAASKRKAILHQCMMKPSVCITTYGLIVTQWEALSKTIDGEEFVWDYIALDEGHRIRNPSKTTKQLHNIPARNRIILTGTPLQNKLCDLWALMDWVTQGSLLGTKKTFRSDYELPIERARQRDSSASEIQLGNSMAASLKKLTDPYILRRTKASLSKEEKENASSGDASKVADGNQDLSTLCNQPTFPKLSTKNDFVVWVYLSDVQQEIYKNFIELDDVKALLTSHRSPLVYLTILKKICDHPRLLSTKACLELGLQSNNDSISEDMNCSTVEECAANRIHNIPDETLIKESGKLQFLIDLLLRLRDEGHRTLIFSMSRKMLNIIQRILNNHKFKIMRLDGRVTKLSEREKRVRKFQEDPSYHVFLLTTQVGGVGLTLTAADRVVIYDPSWNPATDDQAIDRLYRIGQKKSVAVYRLITCGSVEEKIYRRQIFKNSVSQQAVQGNKDPYRYFTRQELFELFSLDDVTRSDTQLQLEQLHGRQRILNKHMQTHVKFIHELYMFGVSDHDLMFSRKADDFDEDETQEELFNDKVEEARNRLKVESDQFTGHSETESRWGMFNEYRKDAQVPDKDLEPIYPIEGISDKLVTMSLPSKDKPSSSNWARSETRQHLQIEDSFDIFGEQVSSDDDPEEGDEELKAAFYLADETNEQERSRKSLHTHETEFKFDANFDDLPDIKKKMSVHRTTADSPLVATTTGKRPFVASDSENSSKGSDDELPSLASSLSQSLDQSEVDSFEKKRNQTASDDVTRPSASYVRDLDGEEADDVVRDLSFDNLDCQKDAISSLNDVTSDATEILDSPNKIGSGFNDSDVGNNKDDVMEQLMDDDGSDASSFNERADDSVHCAIADSPLVATTTRKRPFIASDSESSSNSSAIYPIEGISDKLVSLSLPSKIETEIKFEANFDDLPDIKKEVVNTDEINTNLSFNPQALSIPKITFGSTPVKIETEIKFEANFDDLPDIKKEVVNTDEINTNLSFNPQALSIPKITFGSTPVKNVHCTTADSPLVATTTRKRPFVVSDSENSSNSSAIYPSEGVSDKLVSLSLPSKINTNLSFNPQALSIPKITFGSTPVKNVHCTTADSPLVATTTRKRPFVVSDSENSSNSSAIYPSEGVSDKLVSLSLPSKSRKRFSFKPQAFSIPKIYFEESPAKNVHCTTADSPLVATTTRKRPFVASDSENSSNSSDNNLPSLASSLSQSVNQRAADLSEKKIKQTVDDDVTLPSVGYVSDLVDKEAVDVIHKLSDDDLSCQKDAIASTDDVINDDSDATEILDSLNGSGSGFNDSDAGNNKDDMEQLTDDDGSNASFFNERADRVEQARKRLKVESDQFTGHSEAESRWGMFNEDRRVAQLPVDDLKPIYPIEGVSDKLVTMSLPSKRETEFKFDANFDDLPDVKKEVVNTNFSFNRQTDSTPKITFGSTPVKDEPSSSNWARSETRQSVHATSAISPLVATTMRKRPFIGSDSENSSNSSDDERPSFAAIMSQSLNQSEADSYEKKMKQTADDDVIRNLGDDDLGLEKDASGLADDVIKDDSDVIEILDSLNGSGSDFNDFDVRNDDDSDIEQLFDDDGSDASLLGNGTDGVSDDVITVVR